MKFSGRFKRSNVYSISYYRVTEATGRGVYTITSSEIGSIMQKVIEVTANSLTFLLYERDRNILQG